MRSEVIAAERRPDGVLEVESLWLLSDTEVAQFDRTGLRIEGPDRHVLTQVHHILSPARAATRGMRIIQRDSDGWLLHADGLFLPPDIEPDDPRLWTYSQKGHALATWRRTRGGPVGAFPFVPTIWFDPTGHDPEFFDPQWQRETFARNPDDEVNGILNWKGARLDEQLTRGEPIEEVQRTTLNLQVGASADDAFQAVNDSVTIDGTASNVDHTDEHTGVRFQNVTISQGATIDNAIYSPFLGSGSQDQPLHQVRGELSINAAAFTTTSDDIDSRSRTTATVQWNSANLGLPFGSFQEWGCSTAGGAGTSIESIIQEITDQALWSSGNALVLIYEQHTLDGNRDLGQRFYDFDTAQAAKLDIDFTAGGGGAVNATVTGEAATATSAAVAPTVTAIRTVAVTGEVAAASSASNEASIAAQQAVTVAGEPATATSASNEGTVATVRNAAVAGEAATTTSAALEGAVAAIRTVAVTGETATVAAEAPEGAVATGVVVNATIAGEPASATAQATQGTVVAVRIVVIAGESAEASAAAPDGTVTAIRAVTVAGEPAAASSGALEGTVTSIGIVSVTGEPATATAQANPGLVASLVVVVIAGEPAQATAAAAEGAVTTVGIVAIVGAVAESDAAGVAAVIVAVIPGLAFEAVATITIVPMLDVASIDAAPSLEADVFRTQPTLDVARIS